MQHRMRRVEITFRPNTREIFLVACFLSVPSMAFLAIGPRRVLISEHIDCLHARRPLLYRMSPGDNDDDNATSTVRKAKSKNYEDLVSRGFIFAMYTLPFDALLIHFQKSRRFLTSRAFSITNIAFL